MEETRILNDLTIRHNSIPRLLWPHIAKLDEKERYRRVVYYMNLYYRSFLGVGRFVNWTIPVNKFVDFVEFKNLWRRHAHDEASYLLDAPGITNAIRRGLIGTVSKFHSEIIPSGEIIISSGLTCGVEFVIKDEIGHRSMEILKRDLEIYGFYMMMKKRADTFQFRVDGEGLLSFEEAFAHVPSLMILCLDNICSRWHLFVDMVPAENQLLRLPMDIQERLASYAYKFSIPLHSYLQAPLSEMTLDDPENSVELDPRILRCSFCGRSGHNAARCQRRLL